MTHAIAFDTHAYIKKLKATGVSEEQAEVHAETLSEFLDDQIATKHDMALLQRDIKELETALKRDMKELETALKHDMKEMEMRMTIKLGAISTTGIVIVAALVKLL